MALIRRKQKGCRRVVALGDTHAGHKLGLCPPDVEVTRTDDKGGAIQFVPDLGETQQYLWGLYLKHRKQALDHLGGRADLLIHGGDVTHGTRYTGGLMDIDAGEQVKIAEWNMRPWLKDAKRLRFVSGTPSHVLFGRASAGALVASKVEHPDARAMHHLRIRVGGVLFDIAHHGPGAGIREWLEGNIARYYLRSRVLKDANKLGIEPATVYLRFHHHVWLHETLEMHIAGEPRWCHLIVVPSYCGLSDFARQVTQSTPELTNGLATFLIEGGRVIEVKPFKETKDLRVEETID